MWIDPKHLKGSMLPYLLKNRVKPNFTCSASPRFEIKALGFTRFLVNVAYQAKVVFFSDFQCFGGIRSTQPTQRYSSF